MYEKYSMRIHNIKILFKGKSVQYYKYLLIRIKEMFIEVCILNLFNIKENS